jgi:hypothetical protein
VKQAVANENIDLRSLTEHLRSHLFSASMEPMTAISLIAGSATLAKAAGCAVVGLCDLRSRYGSAPRTVDLLIAQINVLEEAMTEISLWLDTAPLILGRSTTFESRLRISVDACHQLIRDIDEHTAHVKESSDLSGRVRHVWKETQIREWGRLLDSQVLALQLLIHVSKLQVPSRYFRQWGKLTPF